MGKDVEKLYRFIVDGIGIWGVADRDCPNGSPCRENKPDDSWLSKKLEHPGEFSFWKELGLQKYIESGLMTWQTSVVKGKIKVMIIDRPEEALHEDEYYLVCKPEAVKNKQIVSLEEFLRMRK